MQNESIPDARGPVFCGVDTPPTRTGCASWTGGAARSCPASSPPTRQAENARRGVAATREPACVAMERTSSTTGQTLTRHLASLGGCPCARRSPNEDAEERQGREMHDEGGRGRAAARSSNPAQGSRTPRARTGGSTGVRCMLAAPPGATRRGPRRSTPRGRCSPPRRRGSGRGSMGMGRGWRAFPCAPRACCARPALATVGGGVPTWRRDEASRRRESPPRAAGDARVAREPASFAVAAGDNRAGCAPEASFAAICGACPIPASGAARP